MKYRNLKKEIKGFTLIEILVSVAIFVAIIIVLSYFQARIFTFNNFFQSSLNIQQNARKILRPFAEEVRSATLGNDGSFAIASADTDSIEFFSDIDNDGMREKIKYYLDGTEFKKTVIEPSENPFIYDPANEEDEQVIGNVVNGGSPVFEYYDSGYDGSSDYQPLSYPIALTDITLVKATLLVDDNLNQPPSAVEISTQANFRNLSNN